jgi:hypothetical protein
VERPRLRAGDPVEQVGLGVRLAGRATHEHRTAEDLSRG